MTPEEFINGPKLNHPEAQSNPEELQPATESIKNALLELVTQKARSGNEYGNSYGNDLRLPAKSKFDALSITRFKDGVITDGQNRLATFTCVKRTENSRQRQITNYFLIDAPDGVQIEKFSHVSIPYMASLNSLLGNSAPPQPDIPKLIDERTEARGIENELGLTFVSDQEAQELFKLLEQSRPFEQ